VEPQAHRVSRAPKLRLEKERTIVVRHAPLAFTAQMLAGVEGVRNGRLTGISIRALIVG
jgi:hypothetical protein